MKEFELGITLREFGNKLSALRESVEAISLETDRNSFSVPFQQEIAGVFGARSPVQPPDKQTLPMQMAAMRDYAEPRGWTVVASVEDIGSGAKERPKRAELSKLAKCRQLDVIVVSV